MGPQGAYYTQNFDVVLSCGATELKAHISWIENVRAVYHDGWNTSYDTNIEPGN